MVSYNDCDFIRELYAGYFITAVTRINNLAQRYEGGYEFPEVIITNYDPGERERSKPRQLDLFGMWGDGETDHYEIRDHPPAKCTPHAREKQWCKKRKTVSFLCLVNCY